MPDAGVSVGWVRQTSPADGGFQLEVALAGDADGGFALLGAGSSPDLGGGPLEGLTDFALARYAPDGTHLWSRSFARNADFEGPAATALAVLPGGDVVVAGSYTGTPELGGGPLPASGEGSPLFLARFTTGGALVWSRGFVSHVRVGGERRVAFVSAADVAVDAQGNVLVTGSLVGRVDFGSGPVGSEASEEPRFYLARFSPAGEALWSTRFAQATEAFALSFGTAVAVDPAGNVAVAGATSGGEEEGGTAFVGRFSPEGQLQWQHRFGEDFPSGLFAQRVESLAMDADGRVYAAGSFVSHLRFAGEALESRAPVFFDSGAGPDMLLAAFGAGGEELWARELPGLGEGVAHQVEVTADGQLVVRGELFSVAELGTGALVPGPFLARYAADGAPRWTLALDPHLRVSGLALQPEGRVVLGATLSTLAEVGGQRLAPRAREDLVLVQLDVSAAPALAPPLPPSSTGDGGALGFVQHVSGEGEEFTGSMGLRALEAMPDGGFVALGRSDFGTFGGRTFVGRSELVLARYDAGGAHVWSRAFLLESSLEGPVGLAIAVAPGGDLLVTGFYRGVPDLGAGALPRAEGEGLFLARFSPEGRTRWSRGFVARLGTGDAGTLQGRALAVDAEGNLVVTGFLRGAVDLGGGTLGSRTPQTDTRVYAARFDAEGNHLWSSLLAEATAGAERSEGTAVAVDAAGHVLVAGLTGLSESPQEDRAFVARLAPDGTLQWLRRLESTRSSAVRSLAMSADGTAFFAGELVGQLGFAGQTVESLQPGFATDVLLGAFGPGGEEQWVRTLPGLGEGSAQEVKLDEEGQLLVRGELRSVGDLGTGPLVPGPFVARYTPTGSPRGARTFDPHLQLAGLAPQPGGGAVVGATVDAQVQLGATTVTPASFSELLYLQLSP